MQQQPEIVLKVKKPKEPKEKKEKKVREPKRKPKEIYTIKIVRGNFPVQFD